MREKIVLVRVPLGGSMEPCCPEIFVVKPGAQSLSQPWSPNKNVVWLNGALE